MQSETENLVKGKEFDEVKYNDILELFESYSKSWINDRKKFMFYQKKTKLHIVLRLDLWKVTLISTDKEKAQVKLFQKY